MGHEPFPPIPFQHIQLPQMLSANGKCSMQRKQTKQESIDLEDL